MSEVYVPFAVIDFFEPDVFTFECMGAGHTSRSPAKAAIPTDQSLFKMIRVFDLWKSRGIFPT